MPSPLALPPLSAPGGGSLESISLPPSCRLADCTVGRALSSEPEGARSRRGVSGDSRSFFLCEMEAAALLLCRLTSRIKAHDVSESTCKIPSYHPLSLTATPWLSWHLSSLPHQLSGHVSRSPRPDFLPAPPKERADLQPASPALELRVRPRGE